MLVTMIRAKVPQQLVDPSLRRGWVVQMHLLQQIGSRTCGSAVKTLQKGNVLRVRASTDVHTENSFANAAGMRGIHRTHPATHEPY